MIAAIVFDFDGVLADSEPLHLTATQEVLASLGSTLPREEYYARYLGYDDMGMFRALSDARGWSLTDAQIAALVAEKGAALASLIDGADVLYPGAADCVARLAAEWPLGIASGALRHEILAILTRGGLDRHFRFIVASGDTPASKPSADPYRRAAELHGVPPSACVAIEDSKWGIESARAAGLRSIAVASSYPFGELLAADTIVATLAEVTPELIRSLDSG